MKSLSGMAQITYEDPKPFFVDITNDHRKVCGILRSLKASDVIWLLDTHCYYPSIKCPWGCSAFLTESNQTIPFDGVLNAYLDDPSFDTKIVNK